MTDSRFALSVALAPGSGLIARRDHVLLYIPSPDERVKILLDAFTHGPVDETWDRVAEAVIDQGFDVCDFSCVSAAEQIEIRVFGDIALTTDLRSVPMLSGAGSGTWVEHRVPGQPRSASITTASDGVDELTSFRDGIVHAGGFTAALVEQRAASIPPLSSGSASTPSPSPTTVTIPVTDGPLDEHESELMSYVDRLADQQASRETQSFVPVAIDSCAIDTVAIDSGPIDCGPVDSGPIETGTDETGTDDSDSPDPTLDPMEAEVLRQVVAETFVEPVVVASDVGAGSVTVPARVCKAGHANPPSRTTCEICEVFLPSGAEGITLAPRPPLGALVFDDGRRVSLTADVMIGRKPSRNGDHWIPVIVDGERISRTHLTVRGNAWDVFLEDAGSHNGTVVVPADGSQPIALVAGTPLLVEPGATTYFGSSSFQFEGRAQAATSAVSAASDGEAITGPAS